MKGFSNSRIALPVSAGDAIDNWTAPWRARWRTLGARERQGVTIAAWIMGLSLLWALAIAPAWRTTRAAPEQLDQLDAQLQQMQRQANEARELRAITPLGSAQSASALREATNGLGGTGRLLVSGDRATLTLTGATGTQLRDWLSEARSAARARPLEVNLTRGPQGYSGSVIVALSSGGGTP